MLYIYKRNDLIDSFDIQKFFSYFLNLIDSKLINNKFVTALLQVKTKIAYQAIPINEKLIKPFLIAYNTNTAIPNSMAPVFSTRHITRPNYALDRSTILCLYVPGFQRQVFKHLKILSERSKESKEQKKNKESVLVAESAYNAQNAQFGLVMHI